MVQEVLRPSGMYVVRKGRDERTQYFVMHAWILPWVSTASPSLEITGNQQS